MIKINDILGKTINGVLVLRESGRRGKDVTIMAKCHCGNVFEVRKTSLVHGKTKSCGCLAKIQRPKNLTPRKHGESTTHLYTVWQSMKARTTKENCKAFKAYGAVGKTLCKDWFEYENFRDWAIRNGYEEGLSIDRVNNSFGYYPENCRWIPKEMQSRNKTNNLKFLDGKLLIEICNDNSLNYKRAHHFFKNNDYQNKNSYIFLDDYNKNSGRKNKIEHDGKFYNLRELSEIVGISLSAITHRRIRFLKKYNLDKDTIIKSTDII